MPTKDEFTTRAERELKRLAIHEAELEREAEALRLRRVDVQQRILRLNISLAMYRDVMNQQATPEQTERERERAPLPPELRPKATIADMAASIMSAHGGTMRVRDVLTELTQAGKLRGSHGDYGTVYGTLQRDPRFEWAAKGEFRLASANEPWQPE
jgi:hypothetical protein